MNLLGRMKAGDLLELVKGPENEFDSCAIALQLQRTKIGFIPASVNEMLIHLLDAKALSLFAVIPAMGKRSHHTIRTIRGKILF